MGFIHTKIRLRNPRRQGSSPLEVTAMVDTGTNVMCLPAAIVVELGLEGNTTRTVKTAGGASHRSRYVGPVQVQFENRERFVGALELGNDVLLGAIAMEDMDLVLNPARQTVTANPESPETPRAFAVGLPRPQPPVQ